MSDSLLQLEWGAHQYLLPGLRAAWGARLIVNQSGDVDLVPNRQSTSGDEQLVTETLTWLNDGVVNKSIAAIREGLRDGSSQTRQAGGVWLYEDSRGIVLGNSNASAGYFYVVAWLLAALPPGHPTKGADLLVRELAQRVEQVTPRQHPR